MFVTKGVHTGWLRLVAPRRFASTRSSRLASLYAGRTTLLSGVVSVTVRLSASYVVLLVNVSASRLGERAASSATGSNVAVAFGGSASSAAAQLTEFLYCFAIRREDLSGLPLKSWAAL